MVSRSASAARAEVWGWHLSLHSKGINGYWGEGGVGGREQSKKLGGPKRVLQLIEGETGGEGGGLRGRKKVPKFAACRDP